MQSCYVQHVCPHSKGPPSASRVSGILPLYLVDNVYANLVLVVKMNNTRFFLLALVNAWSIVHCGNLIHTLFFLALVVYKNYLFAIIENKTTFMQFIVVFGHKS